MVPKIAQVGKMSDTKSLSNNEGCNLSPAQELNCVGFKFKFKEICCHYILCATSNFI